MPSGFAERRAPLTPVESHIHSDRNTGSAPGQFMGDISPTETWQALQSQAEAVLVDVRTRAEWAYIGGPDLASLGKPVIQVEWQMSPTMDRNPGFVKELQAQVTSGQVVYLLCRSGIRSRSAAELLGQLGYTTYNVAEGFEGSIDGNGHRGASGWRAENLPWKQS